MAELFVKRMRAADLVCEQTFIWKMWKNSVKWNLGWAWNQSEVTVVRCLNGTVALK